MTRLFNLALAASAVALSVPATAAQFVFVENFNTSTPGTYGGQISNSQFSTTSGNVDVLGVVNGNFFSCASNPLGNCIDLVGNSGTPSAISSTPIALTAGNSYAISFDVILQGFGFGAPETSDYRVTLGDFTTVLTVGVQFQGHSLAFLQSTSGNFALTFTVLNAPDTVHGPVLANIAVEEFAAGPGPVPEPATWASLIAGFGIIGAMRRRTWRTRRAA